jgi:hypothetical protein
VPRPHCTLGPVGRATQPAPSEGEARAAPRPSVRLIVEVDGGYHVTRRGADKRRDRTLSQLGYRVLRLPERGVTSNVRAAVQLIRTSLL